MFRACKMNVKKSNKKVVLELLSACNLKCKHCFYRNLKIDSNSFLPKKEAFRLVNKFKKNKIEKVVLTGGEPTIHPNFVEISKYAIKNIGSVSLCTNGFISDNILMNEIVSMNFSGYTVSIDSHIEKEHDIFRGKNGAWKRAIYFLKKLKESEKKISIHIVLHIDNIDDIEETIRFCKKFDCEIVVGTIYFNEAYFKKNNFSDERKNNYINKLKKFKIKHKNDKSIIMVGFYEYCKNSNCLDQKNIFMINKNGCLVKCYWKKNGGQVIKKY